MNDRASKKQQAISRGRLMNLKRLNTALKAEKEALKLKCGDLLTASGELQERLSSIESEVASKDRELEKLSGEVRQLQQREKDQKKLQMQIAQNGESLRLELSRMKAVIKEGELERSKISIELGASQEKLKNLEKDNSRKKTIADDAKTKLALVTAEKQEAIQASLQLEAKLKASEDGAKSLRKTNELFKSKATKLQEEAVNKDVELKASLEDLRIKDKELKKLTRKLKESDGSLSELEVVARREMENLVETSESQLSALQSQVSVAHQFQELLKATLMQFAKFACETHQKVAAESIRKLRSSMKPTSTSGEGDMLGAAKTTAKEILQLSDDDIDDIMSCLSLSGGRPDLKTRDGSRKLAEINANCENWIAAVQVALTGFDEKTSQSLFFLLKSKLQEILSCEDDCRERFQVVEHA